MARPGQSPLDYQVTRVWRRLFCQTLLNALIVCWLPALLLSAAWMLLQPWLNVLSGQVPAVDPFLRWAVAAHLAGLATLAALVLTWYRSPSRVESALALDERFRLKERATTGLLLSDEEVRSPAGQALLDDVNQRVLPLRIGERFPVRLPWTASLLPAAGLLLALTLLYHPRPGQARDGDNKNPGSDPALAENAREDAQKAAEKRQSKQGERKKPTEIERLKDETNDLLSRPNRDRSEDGAKDRVKQATDLEAQLKKRDRDLARRDEALKAQMRQLARLSKNQEQGPGDKLNRALDRGDYKRASAEAERLRQQLEAEEQAEQIRKKLEDENLSKEEREKLEKQLEKLKSKKLTPKQKEQLANQLKTLQAKLDMLSKKLTREQKDQLANQLHLDPEELERQLEQLQQDTEKFDPDLLKKLAEVADKLRECQKCLARGKDAEAAKLLEEIVDHLAALDPNAEREEIAKLVEKLIRDLGETGEGIEGGGNNPALGRRPESKDGKTQGKDEQARSELDKGRLRIVDLVPGQGFKGPRKPDQMTEEIRQASQAAPEAIDRQRLPKGTEEMAKGFFQNQLGTDKKGGK